MAYDKLEFLLDRAGDGIADITANTTGDAVFIGEGRALLVELRVGGAVTGTSPTLDVALETSQDGTSGWQTLAVFPQQTDSMANGTQQGDPPALATIIMPKGRPYLRANVTVGGTSPSFGRVSLMVRPILDALVPAYTA